MNLINHVHEIQIAAASGIAVITATVDAVTDAKGWEDVSLKVLLIASLVFVVRLLLKQQDDHKAEMEKTWAIHKAEAEKREDKLAACMTAQNGTLERLCELTEEQTMHYRQFVKAAVDAKINPAAKP